MKMSRQTRSVDVPGMRRPLPRSLARRPGRIGLALVLIALCGLVTGCARREREVIEVGNPAAPDPRGDTGPIRTARGVYAITRHPMMWSFVLWAIVHILLWGSRANLIVSGGVLFLALLGMIGQDFKKLRLQGGRWRDWMDRTAFIPFAGQISGRVRWRTARPGWGAFIGGLVIFLGATWVHPLTGGPVVGVWRLLG